MVKAIYVITNIINGKQYVGQTIHPKKRWWEHKNRSKTNYDEYPIHMAISKYGEENFTFEIIEWTEDYDNKEIQTIKELNTISPNGYNISSGGNNNVMYGEDHPRNTIEEKTVLSVISDLKNNNLSDREIAKKYNTSDKIIADINHGYSHYQNNEVYPIRKKIGLQKLSTKQVEEIKTLLKETTMTYQEIADNYNVSKGTIYHINKGLTFFKENDFYPIRRCC